ncbi:HpyAIV family type II restriction enzyme [Mycoplasma sp. Mirounga ES2805-ORL]|uniref:HpyAIV family type II restriction enzyme n=1 Tax=Mycoplasma sp. Mirounga ES2805-ORL TaxID=754514 RepID=UPI00197B1064|nr:hypothetical protein [Mycoplasma sp. Mirounga ES2805-ORL]QSF13610.1 hypothetical protein JXZ90_03010 [Mycoplasma sp. Mirounga ES2805-ORL]
MNYIEFETNLKSLLSRSKGPNLLLKLIDAPYRFYSVLNPFSFQTKLKQTFLRTQENIYFKFIKTCAEEIFINNLKLIPMDNKIDVPFQINDENNEELNGSLSAKRVVPTFLFTNEEKTKVYSIFLRKRDVYGANEINKIFNKFKENSELLTNYFKESEVVSFLWFVDEENRKNEELLHEQTRILNINSSVLNVVYSSEIFAYFNAKEEWENINQYLMQFKFKNYDFFLNMPDLDSDKETYEALVNLSNSAWEKLNSDEPIYKEIRLAIFNDKNPNSNLLKAYQMRSIKQKTVDEDELKNETIKAGLN